jgi:Ser/Thr protein kinase RdoA (MazF antagonist)
MYRASPAEEGVPSSNTELRTGVKLRSPDTLRAQLRWLSALGREIDLLVPEPVPMADGSLVDYVSFSDLPLHRTLLSRVRKIDRDVYDPAQPGRYCVLLRWVPGEHKEDNDLVPADLSSLGSYVARLHTHAQRYSASRESALPRWSWEWVFGERAPLWSEGEAYYSAGEMGVFHTAARHVREDLERLGEHREVFGVIHRDLTPNNVVFDGTRVGAIDFDQCGLGYYTFDLGVVRRALRLYRDRQELLWAAFVEGYERECPLPEGYQRYLTTFEVLHRVLAINRQLRLLSSEDTAGQARSTEQLRVVARWLRQQLRRWGT